jgi:alpha-amylase
MTEDGVPCIYYGTEQEFDGGNDPYNRERLWDTRFDTSGATFQWIQKLIRIRKAYAPLRQGVLSIVWATTHVAAEEDANLVAFERAAGGHTILVVLNTSDTQTSETSSAGTGGAARATSFAAGTALVDILAAAGDASGSFTVAAGGALTVPVAPRGARILVPATDVVALP